MNLRRLLLGTALARLRAAPSYLLVSVFLLGIAGTLVALAGGWLYVAALKELPYRSGGELYFVRVSDRFTAAMGYGDEVQASTRVVERLFAERALPGPMLVGERRKVELAFEYGGAGEVRDGIALMAVSGNFWEVLGTSPRYGTPARPGSGEVVISHALARALFGSPQLALDRVIDWDRSTARVVGVMGEDFLAPMKVSSQYKTGGRIDIYQPVSWDRSGSPEEEMKDSPATEMAVVVRYPGRVEDLRAGVAARMLELDEAFGRPGLMATVTPLAAHMKGEEARLATWLMLATGLLSATALSGVALLSLGRFAGRAGDVLVLHVLGVRPADESMFERYEAGVLVVLAGGVGLAFLAAGLSSFTMTGTADGGPPPGLAVAALAVFGAYWLLSLGLMMGAAVWNARQAATYSGVVRNTRGAAKGGLRRGWLRLVHRSQTVLALALVTWVLGLLGDAIGAFDAARQARFANIVQWRLDYMPGAAPQDIAEHVEKIRRRLLRLPEVEGVAVGLVPALDLRGVESAGYRGPYAVASEVIAGDADSFITRGTVTAPKASPVQVSYQLWLAVVEPAYLSLLGYRMIEGRVFAAGEEDVVVLTPESARAIFGRSDRVSTELVPGSARVGRDDPWHNWLRVVGVVAAGRVGSATVASDPFTQMPVAFLPYRQPPALPVERSRSLYLLIRHRPGSPLPAARLDGILGADDSLLVRTEAKELLLEARERLMGHLIASLGTLLLGAAVLASAALGTLGIVGMLLAARGAEVGVRLAVGGEESRIAWWLARRELSSPLFLVLAWWALVVLADALARQIGVSLPFAPSSSLVAGSAVLVALSSGFLMALRGLFRRSPMDALRSE